MAGVVIVARSCLLLDQVPGVVIAGYFSVSRVRLRSFRSRGGTNGLQGGSRDKIVIAFVLSGLSLMQCLRCPTWLGVFQERIGTQTRGMKIVTQQTDLLALQPPSPNLRPLPSPLLRGV